MDNYFSYNNGSSVLSKDSYRISPSQLSKFFDQTSVWYREQLLGESTFEGNTATELGNCIHYAAQMLTEGKPIDYSLIDKYILSIDNPEVDHSIISEQYPYMIDALQSSGAAFASPTAVCESFVYHEVLPNIYASGSVDRYDPSESITYQGYTTKASVITDWKTMGSLDSARVPTSFPRQYWFQQNLYAWILRQNGKPVDYCKLVYITRSNVGRVSEKTGKPLKDYPSEVHTLIEPVTQESMDIIEGVVKVVAESIHLWNTQPELRHILAQDWRLKSKLPPKLFINKD